MTSGSAHVIKIDIASFPVAGQPWIGYLLNQVANRIRTLTATALEPLGLTPPMLRALEAIEAEQPLTQARLGLSVHMDRTTVVHVVDRFEALGYARRGPDPADRRSHALALTAEGAAALARARRLARDAEDAVLATLSGAERERLGGLLRKIHQPTLCPEEPR